MQLRTLEGGAIEVDPTALSALQGGIALPMLTPGEPGFDDSVRLWNGMIRKLPALVVRPTGVADVLHALRFVRERGILMSIKGGGHNIAGTALADGGLVLDMGRMKGIHVDRQARCVRVQAGCLLGDVDRETAVHGLAAVLGFVSETGVAGLTLGGGFGYLTRQHGWTVDTLREVELVTADGRVVRASRDEEPELFWALRGGGGNFGVVTSFVYELHHMPPRILGGLAFWDAAHAPDVLGVLREWSASAPRTVTSAVTVRKAPPAPFLPKEWHGRDVLGWVVCHMGDDLERARQDLAPVRQARRPIVDLIGETTYVAQQRLIDATQRKGPAYYWKTEYLPRLDADLLPILCERARAVTSPMSGIQMFQLEGALSERAPNDGAVGNRDARWMCAAAGSWPPEDPRGAEHEAWVRDTWSRIRPFSTGGSYVNFQTAEEGDDRVHAAYGGNYARLAAVKRAVDPHNLFRVNRNVRPS